MVSLLYFFPIKLGQFQPFEAMHKPIASPGFGFGGKKIVSVNRSRNSINRSHIGLQPVATDHFGTRTKKNQCLPVEFPGKPVESNRSTGLY